MKLTEQQRGDLASMADWLELKATENWDGYDDEQVRWFLDNVGLIRGFVQESEVTA